MRSISLALFCLSLCAADEIQVNANGQLSSPTLFNPVLLKNPINVQANRAQLAAGNTDVYTAPPARRAAVYAVHFFNTANPGTAAFAEAKISGVYLPLQSSVTVAGKSAVTSSIGYVLEPGETLAVNTATGGRINFFASIIEFDATSSLRTVTLRTFVAGNNTAYTVPAMKTAVILSNGLLSGGGTATYVNTSGSTRSEHLNVVPAIGTPAIGNQISADTNVTNNNALVISIADTMSTGSMLSISVDAATATQFFWISILEY